MPLKGMRTGGTAWYGYEETPMFPGDTIYRVFMGYNQSQLVFYQWTTKNGWFSSGSLQPIGKQNALGDLTSLRSQFWSDTSWACGQRATSRFPEKHRGTSLISGEKTPPFVVHFPDGNHVFFAYPRLPFDLNQNTICWPLHFRFVLWDSFMNFWCT